MSTTILRIAVPSPLHRIFDYRPPSGCNPALLQPGMRVLVPFGRSRTMGILLGLAAKSDVPPAQLRTALEVLDEAPVLAPELLELALWAADYYHHSAGEVLAGILPPLLRRGRTVPSAVRQLWRVTESGRTADPDRLGRAHRQASLLRSLQASPQGLDEAALAAQGAGWRTPLSALHARGWVEPCTGAPDEAPPRGEADARERAPELSQAQRAAVEAIAMELGRFAAFLLDGVTGSGKTEVYLRVVERVVSQGRQALVLVPEIGLTPQLLARFEARFAHRIAVLHSGLSEGERGAAWLAARSGDAAVVIGTRSAVFAPLARPGLVIVDEEHDLSLKQQEGFRYSARDVAVMRARRTGIPVVLGSATPALESLYNARRERYQRLTLPERAGAAVHPRIEVIDVRSRPLDEGLSPPLLQAVQRHLQREGQILLFLNRRGFAPTLLCHDCGWIAECRRCDARLTLHQAEGHLRCHHCGACQRLRPACQQCGSSALRALGQGTERVERALRRRFPEAVIARIDRDTTRRKGTMDAALAAARAGTSDILIGTQMLAKGHDFPKLTLACVLDADHGLFSADFRGGERMAQLLVQVAGRAGRAERPGEVLIQTHNPDHPLLRLLIGQGYHAYAEAALRERQAARLPPFASLALLRAEGAQRELVHGFLEQARRAAAAADPADVEMLGPVPAPMERRAGRYRAQLLLQSPKRAELQALLARWVPTVAEQRLARRVRWSIDVDPMELY
jgi:primosomal protein N' (replication factor Y) (superfamily II helicase)